MATTVILIRHGETDWNREGRYQGKIDVPLNERGRAQAIQLAEGLKAIPFDAAWSSQLSRARVTAEVALGDSGLEVREHKGLAEIDHGEWEGKLAAEVARDWPEQVAAWRKTPETVQMPGGETVQIVQDRAVAAMKEIVAACAGQTVLVAAHDAVNKTLLCWAAQAPLSRFWAFKQDSTAVNALRFEGAGPPTILLCNSIAHTGKLLSGIVHKAL